MLQNLDEQRLQVDTLQRMSKHQIITCPECSGTGKILQSILAGEIVCTTCMGEGKTYTRTVVEPMSDAKGYALTLVAVVFGLVALGAGLAIMLPTNLKGLGFLLLAMGIPMLLISVIAAAFAKRGGTYSMMQTAPVRYGHAPSEKQWQTRTSTLVAADPTPPLFGQPS